MRIARPLALELTTVPNVLTVAEQCASAPYPLLLDSATHGTQDTPTLARYSFAMANPTIVVRARETAIEWHDCQTGTTVRHMGRALDFVQQYLVECHREPLADVPPFQGGFAGYIGYEYGGVLERIPRAQHESAPNDDLVLAWYPWVIAWDHAQDRAWIIAESNDALADAQRILAMQAQQISPPHTNSEPTEFSSSVTQQVYESAIERIREYIAAGDVFQVNLSHQFATRLYASPWSLYKTLRTNNPAPFAAFFDTGDAAILSSSPERFLYLSTTGHIETRPIKGTRPRGTTPALDQIQRNELLASEKDAAEHVMIVDVLRNDIAHVAQYGSVQVPELMTLESYATVHHLVSSVVGQLRSGTDAVDLLNACFPGGSITGAPKIRAMEIIAELEPVTRGVYCGTIGYLSASGAMDSNIAIRTAVITKTSTGQHVTLSAGGGIVHDSRPTDEYAETLDKARALMQAITTVNAGLPLSL